MGFNRDQAVSLVDVMTGRGIDQILPHPCEPEIYEDYLKSALDYVVLAERVNGPIKRPVACDTIWGEALDELSRQRPHARIVNLETAVTASGTPEPKGINYRMNPANIAALTAAEPRCLRACEQPRARLGRTRPARYPGFCTRGGHPDHRRRTKPPRSRAARHYSKSARQLRVLVFGLGLESSGIPSFWTAGAHRPGVRLLPDLSEQTAAGARLGGAFAETAGRHRGFIDPLGLELGIQDCRRTDHLRPHAHRSRCLRYPPWPFLAPHARHRNLSPQAHPLWLRGLHQRL